MNLPQFPLPLNGINTHNTYKMDFLQFLGIKKAEKSLVLNQAAAVPAQINFRLFNASPLVYFADDTDTYLSKGFESNHVVFTIADWIGKKMTLAPPILYSIKDKSAAKEFHAMRKEGSIENHIQSLRIKSKAFEEVETHPLLDVLKRPNPTMTWDEFVYGYFIFKTFVGNSLIQGISTDKGLNAKKIQELWLLPSQFIQAVSGSGLNIVDFYQDSRNPNYVIPTEEVLQIRNFSTNYRTAGSQLSGMSVLKAANKLLKQSNEAIDAQAESFQNRGASKVVFPIMKDGSTIVMPDGVSVDASNEDFRKRIKEAGNKGVVVSPVEIGKIDIGMSPADMEILQSQQFNKQDWCSLFHVDSRIVLNDHQSSTKDNMQGATLYSLTDGVFPHLTALANGLNQWFVPTWDDKLFLDFDTTLYAEVQRQQRETVKDMSDSGLFTIDEMRAIMKYGNYEGLNGDKILVSSNKQILDELSNALPDGTGTAGY